MFQDRLNWPLKHKLSEYEWHAIGKSRLFGREIEFSKNKTHCQLCVPFSWSCLVWKRVYFWIWSLVDSHQQFSCVLGHFWYGDERTNRWSLCKPALDEWEGSLLQKKSLKMTRNVGQLLGYSHFWTWPGGMWGGAELSLNFFSELQKGVSCPNGLKIKSSVN